MKKVLPVIAGLLSATGLMAQLANGSTAPNFTLTDLNGTSWDLYTVLGQGKTVFLDVSATWCGPCWSYHNTHALRDVYDHYGPTGTVAPNSVMVFYVEGDGATTLQDLQGTGGNTQGDWVTGTPYPIFNPNTSQVNTFNSNFQIAYFPTIYRICPDKKVFLAGQSTESALLNTINTCVFTLDAGVQSVSGIPTITCGSTITPTVTIRNGGTTTLTSCTITYDVDGSSPQTYNWSGSLANNATANVTLPAITVSNGTHAFHAITSGPNSGTDGNATNNYSTVNFTAAGSGPGVATPVTEGFVSSTFPPAGFSIGNTDNGITWARSTAAGGFGNSMNSAKMDCFNYATTGEKDEIVMSPVDLASVSNSTLTFNVAHAQYSASYTDQLEVFVSTNCGTTWTQVYNKSGSTLSTAPATTNAFTPSASQWRTETVSLNTYIGNNKVFVKFVSTNGYGNNIYLDDINITGTTGINTVTLQNGFQVYPNPVNGQATVSFALANESDVTMQVFNLVGELVQVKNLGSVTSGNHQAVFSSEGLSKGVYYIELNAGGQKAVQKIIVSE
ncbi:MAG: hypothetical protein FD123_3900 [Bacteroidetes bacterium]|nr:MAG: hypothetical protein FD123_3900 [Bacteroidota bacterium]